MGRSGVLFQRTFVTGKNTQINFYPLSLSPSPNQLESLLLPFVLCDNTYMLFL